MSVTVTYRTDITVAEILDGNVVGVTGNANKTVNHTALNKLVSLNSSTTPPATRVAIFDKAMTTGAASIDLTALSGTNGNTVNGTGLKVQAVKFFNSTANSVITVQEGTANGYALLGASFTMNILPGQEVVVYGNDASPDVAGGDKTIDISGTGTESLSCVFVLG